MVRAAAKNYKSVAIVVDPDDYSDLAITLKETDGELDEERRFNLATKAFAHTAQYDGAIADYLRTRLLALQASKRYKRYRNIFRSI